LRRTTTLFKITDAEVVARSLAFKSYIDELPLSNFPKQFAIAMDETAVYYGRDHDTTVERTGATSVSMLSTGYESQRVTCILAIRLDGTKLPPCIITKKSQSSNDRVEIKTDGGVWIAESPKAWSTQPVLRKWVAKALPYLERMGRRGLLVWDSASTHRAKDMKRYLDQQRVTQAMIPSGTTPYLQSLDIAIMKPFKDAMNREITYYKENEVQLNARGNPIKPSLQQVVGWVRAAWETITPEMVVSALRRGYLSDESFHLTHVCQHERLGPMVAAALREGLEISPTGDLVDELDDLIIEEDSVSEEE
jgi:hypothetical protein